jgi:hypothetical protein
MIKPSANNWQVQITAKGPYGSVVYQEGLHSASFLWQFGGGEIIAMIHLTPSLEWNERYPWAADRRDEVLERMVNDVILQKCHDCMASIVEQNGESYVYFRKPA